MWGQKHAVEDDEKEARLTVDWRRRVAACRRSALSVVETSMVFWLLAAS